MSGDPRTRVEALREELGKSICINDSEAGVVSWALAELSRVLDDDHDTPTADAVPDVPPDPPAATRDELARAWDEGHAAGLRNAEVPEDGEFEHNPHEATP